MSFLCHRLSENHVREKSLGERQAPPGDSADLPALLYGGSHSCHTFQLLGLAIGDALGGKFQAQSTEAIRARFHSVDALIVYPQEELWYMDDTQMAIGVAETAR